MPDQAHHSDGELIDLIYAALLGESPWQMFVDRLSVSMPEGKTVLFFHDANHSKGSYGLTSALDDNAVAAHNEYYSAINPWMPRASIRKIGVGVIADQMLAQEELFGTEFYNDFLLPNGVRSAVGVTIDREDGLSFLLSTMTSQTDPELNQPFADRLTRLAPHLKRASNYYRNNSTARAATELGASLFDAVDVGLIVIGDRSRIKAISEAGQAMLHGISPFGISPSGRIRFRNDDADAILQDMLGRTYTGPKVAHLFQHGTRLTLIRAQKNHISLFFEEPTVVVLMERPGSSTRTFDVEQFALLYRLSRAETRAFSGIMEGKNITQIADEAGLSRETIRTQMKSLYAKTGVNGQADLLHLVYGPWLRV